MLPSLIYGPEQHCMGHVVSKRGRGIWMRQVLFCFFPAKILPGKRQCRRKEQRAARLHAAAWPPPCRRLPVSRRPPASMPQAASTPALACCRHILPLPATVSRFLCINLFPFSQLQDDTPALRPEGANQHVAGMGSTRSWCRCSKNKCRQGRSTADWQLS